MKREAAPGGEPQLQPEPNPSLTCPGSLPAVWTELIGQHEWGVYLSVIQRFQATNIPFVLGGAFGLAAYTGRWRNTKDMDFFVLPQDRPRAVQALVELGLADYYDTLAYDRGWIYRATRSDVIVDVIWGTPNRRTEVDPAWFQYARRLQLRDELVRVIPAEELVWIKLYVLQRDRCDWPDVINLLYATSSTLDWDRLVERLGNDLPLLQGLLTVFVWLCPDRVRDIPVTLRKRLDEPGADKASSELDQRRLALLDTRPWFSALQPPDQPLRI